MATKKDNLPLTLDQENDSTGTITYANEVIAIIAGALILAGAAVAIVLILSKNKKK